MSRVTRIAARIAQLSPDELDVHNLMEKGLPSRDYHGSVIKSNYPLSAADIYITYDVNEYRDPDDKRKVVPDDRNTQLLLSNPKQGQNPCVLLIWPDLDIKANFEAVMGGGGQMSSASHQLDENGKPKPDGQYFFPSDVGVKNFSEILSNASPGSLVTNAEFLRLCGEHGYSDRWI